LNGIDGLSISMIQAFFSYMKYAKLVKMQKKETAKPSFFGDLFCIPVQRRLERTGLYFLSFTIAFLILTIVSFFIN